jgi:hypothetical protein
MRLEADAWSPMTLTVRMINFMGLLLYLGGVSILTAILGTPGKLHFSTFLMLTPLGYFGVGIVTSFARRRCKSVLLLGVLAHGIVAFASVAALAEQSYWPLMLFIIYALAWFTMYWKLPSV